MALTNMSAVALSPKAGAHGELCGMMAIKTAIAARGEAATRKVVLIPQSAHGTNPATRGAARLFGARRRRRRRMESCTPRRCEAALGPDVAAIMLTNPNTCGLFEREIVEIADAVHEAGGYFYCDGANFNAIAGVARPGDFGVDAMHINLHKTFSTPHGGGGPGAGPVVLSERLAPFAPVPFISPRRRRACELVEHAEGTRKLRPHDRLPWPDGHVRARALAYMLAHGADGLRQASRDAVLSANYVRASLRDVMTQPFGDRPACMKFCSTTPG